jgi:hypothetical protein
VLPTQPPETDHSLTWRHHRAVYANARKMGDAETAERAGRDMYAGLLEEHVASVLAKAPPLTDAQLDRIAAVLRSSRARKAGDAA